ncbi:MAG: bifunctional riboflavin kinase/FAD synthetase [Bacteroidales bacterium]|jgi:riboflavin kinase/FMN adenylyltransferase|nr:bifunctional riboflavin kinase/FAD synthetase [Bacteroidales bacterium]
MQIFDDIIKIPKLRAPVVTIGTFDGVHLGHQQIFHRMKSIATETGSKAVAVTFEPHPRFALEGEDCGVKLINIPEKKYERIALQGIDYLIIIKFTSEFASLSPEQFIADYLVKYLNIGTLIIGYDHHFGKSRGGNYKSAEELGKKYHFRVEEIKEVVVDGIVVSSTNIRNELKTGNVEMANKLLGYQYSITGEVVQGNMIGRTLGFPTINIKLPSKYKLIAANGVYACYVLIDNVWYKGMGNIGMRPTIPNSPRTMEIHVFNFDKDIYGAIVTIAFVERLRDEMKFNGLEELRRQLHKDKIDVEEILSRRQIQL